MPDCIEGRFAEFWQQNGGLSVFGLPKSAASQQHIAGLMLDEREYSKFSSATQRP